MSIKTQVANYINCQLGLEGLGCLTNFCTAVASCISTSAITANLKAATSAGILFESANGTDVALFGAGNGAGATFYGGVLLNTMTAGSILFAGASGLISQDNSSLFFDNTNNFLGILTAAPTHTITLGSTNTGLAFYNTTDQTTNFERRSFVASANKFNITGAGGGTGTPRGIRIGINSSGATLGGVTYIDYAANALTYTVRAGTASTLGHFFTVGSNTSSSGTQAVMSITATVNHSSTAGYTGILCNITETSTGSGAKNLMLLQVGGVTKFGVDNAGKISIGNTVAVGAAIASTHTVTINVGGSDYKFLVSNV